MKAFVIFEDDHCNNFYPLSLTRPVWDLRAGIFTFRERWERAIRKKYGDDAAIFYFCRGYLAPWYRDANPQCEINSSGAFYQFDDFTFLNATTFPTGATQDIRENTLVMFRNQPLAARISAKKLNRSAESILSMIRNSSVRTVQAHSLDDIKGLGKACFVWDLVTLNSRLITEDFALFTPTGDKNIPGGVTIAGETSQIYTGDGVSIEPYVLIDVRKGPVIIDDGVVINAFTRIEGPAYIGRNTRLLGARVRGGCSLGMNCRVGGEVEESIFHGFSNKYHDGFIGHSYVGEWVNLGALTSNSDLKNNYKDVKVYIPEVRKNTKSNKIGCFIGDHVKTSIGTLINTGTSIGPGAMLVHSGTLTPYHIPPFSWYIRGSIENMAWLEDFISTTRNVMSRRGVVMSDSYESLIKEIYNQYKRDEKGS